MEKTKCLDFRVSHGGFDRRSTDETGEASHAPEELSGKWGIPAPKAMPT